MPHPAANRRTPLGHAYAEASAPNPFGEEGRDRRYPVADGDILLHDLTACGRFGIKGRGAGAWLESRGITLPQVNRMAPIADELDLARLGAEDFVILSRPAAPSPALAGLRAQWEQDAGGPKGFNAWREEIWAWFHLSGDRLSGFMSKTCPVDLDRDRFALLEIAQTRVAQMDCIVIRTDRTGQHGFDLFFDAASSEFALRSLEELGA
jgi:glycine cleavage system aminomethyltransferase T